MLEIQKLSAQYRESRVIFDVSLHVEKGQLVSVIGSNGAGKSTVLRVLSGLLKPVSGTVTFEGEDLTVLHAHEIVERGVSLVPEGKMLFAKMSVKENLIVGSVARRAKAARGESMKRVFEMFPILHDRKEQLAGSLSGGEQQMLAIGRGLMSNPKLIALDEPTLGLAPLVRQEIFRTLSQLKKDGLTLLLVDQNLTQVLKISDYSYVLENGKIVMEGPGDVLMADERTKKAYMGL